MRVIYLGKERYRARADVAAFLEGADARGHSVELSDRAMFLRTDLSDVDVVLAKSHYKDRRVQQRLRESGVRVINDVAATDLCQTRSGVAGRLADHGVAIPPFLRSPADRAEMDLPWIAKPDLGGDHTLRTLTEHPETVDLDGTFYQQFFPTDVVSKVYSIGSQHVLIALSYETTGGLVDPVRADPVPAPPELAEISAAVGLATGLEVFNTDVVIHGGVAMVIDVNPFPGLGSFPYSHDALWILIEADRV